MNKETYMQIKEYSEIANQKYDKATFELGKWHNIITDKANCKQQN